MQHNGPTHPTIQRVAMLPLACECRAGMVLEGEKFRMLVLQLSLQIDFL